MKSSLSLSLQKLASKLGIGVLMTLAAFSINIALLSNHAAVASTADAGFEEIDQEVLWFARAIYSETKKPEEQTLVAWVIRNRVESDFYPDTYKEVVLQQGQFSGMHASDRQYSTNIALDYDDSNDAWNSALSIARAVYFADPILRPLPAGVMHFYSPVSVTRTPSWASEKEPAHIVRDPATNSVRFAFYADIM
jgi:spore germination cell wall hydrolase CwlJ-like protein